MSDPISVANGVMQGEIPAPTLFSLYFAVVFYLTAQDCHGGIYIRYHTADKLFNIPHFDAPTRALSNLFREFLYADDCDIFAHSLKCNTLWMLSHKHILHWV